MSNFYSNLKYVHKLHHVHLLQLSKAPKIANFSKFLKWVANQLLYILEFQWWWRHHFILVRILVESGVWTRERQKIFFPTFRDKERGTQSLQLAGCLYQSWKSGRITGILLLLLYKPLTWSFNFCLGTFCSPQHVWNKKQQFSISSKAFLNLGH